MIASAKPGYPSLHPERSRYRIKALDFFCGAGGLTRGLLDAGIDVLAGIDNDSRLKRTYEENNDPSRFIDRDIGEINIHALRRLVGIDDEDLVLYAACTPCQPFSTLNRMKGEDPRKHLLLKFAQLVEEAPPHFILVENVPGLNTAYGREVYESFMQTLERCGFEHTFAAPLDAKDYGVPQVRKRFIMIASKLGEVAEPERKDQPPTVAEAIKKFPPIRDGEEPVGFPNHHSRKLQPHHRVIVEAIPLDGGSRSEVKDTSILLKCHQDKPNAHKDVFGRIAWKGQAPTLTCRCTDVYCGRFVHPEQHRGISLREAAALQTFGDDYVFHGTFYHAATQIGNAVPVELSRRLGKSIINSIPRHSQ